MTDQATLEYIICANLRPTFLIIDQDSNGDIKIIISADTFAFLNIEERINKVFTLLYDKCSYILNKRLVIVEAYDSTELDELLEYIFDKEQH